MTDSSNHPTELLDAVWANAPGAIVVYDADGVIAYANPATVSLSGYTLAELRGFAGAAFIHPEDRTVAFERFVALKGDPGGSVTIEQRLLTKQGDTVWISAHLTHLVEPPLTGWVVSYFHDIERERSLEGQLIHAQRRVTSAPASAYLAHDLNNLMMLAQGNLDLASTAPAHEVETHLEAARNALAEASSVSNQILSIARRHPPERRGLSVTDLIDEIAPTFSKIIPADVDFVVEVDPACVVFGDRVQLAQVVLNLLNNSGEAIEGAGTIALRAATVPDTELTSRNRLLPSRAPHDEWVEIRIIDDGPGVPVEITDKLFRPFVSTKGDAGTGLGLAIADRVVQEFRGFIDFESIPGRGTTFFVYLPQHRAELDWHDDLDAGHLAFGTESVLISVADADFHHYLHSSLSNLGYSVASSLAGEPLGAGVNLSGFDLLIIEANSVAGDPTAVARQFRRAAPDVPLLIISDDDGEATLIDLTECTTLARPFGVKRLADATRAALDPSSSASG